MKPRRRVTDGLPAGSRPRAAIDSTQPAPASIAGRASAKLAGNECRQPVVWRVSRCGQARR
jgi:hypothetical protein